MMSEQIAGFIRHTLTLVGGIAVAKGLMDEQMMLEGVGILMSAIGFVWSFKAKDKAE
jgi:hypothetical protein